MSAKTGCALIVIDVQNEIVDHKGKMYIPNSKGVVAKVAEALSRARELGIPVFHVVREHSADGSDIEAFRKKPFAESGGLMVAGAWGSKYPDGIDMLPGEAKIVKKRFSAFFGTGLDQKLRAAGVGAILICGVQTPNCIRATAVDGVMMDYDTAVVEDATAAASAQVHRSNLDDMARMGIKIVKLADIN